MNEKYYDLFAMALDSSYRWRSLPRYAPQGWLWPGMRIFGESGTGTYDTDVRPLRLVAAAETDR